jgi:hypothetical protein
MDTNAAIHLTEIATGWHTTVHVYIVCKLASRWLVAAVNILCALLRWLLQVFADQLKNYLPPGGAAGSIGSGGSKQEEAAAAAAAGKKGSKKAN